MQATLEQMSDTAPKTLRITLVDDDPSVRSAVSRLLRSNNYACKTYESAESALIDPDFAGVDCLVLDVQLSGMNGFALRDRLREMGSFPLPVCSLPPTLQPTRRSGTRRLAIVPA